MFCKFCGAKIDDNAVFCSGCGKKQSDTVSTQKDNNDALIRRANKMIEEFDRYPLMPTGNLGVEFIEKVFDFDPLFVLKDLRKSIMNMFLEQTNYNYDEKELLPLLEETYGKNEKKLMRKVYGHITENFQEDFDHTNFLQHSYMSLRPKETMFFYYAFSAFYIAKKLNDPYAMYYSRVILKTLDVFHCEKSTTPFDGIGQTGKMLELSEFSADREVYDKMLQMIEDEIELCENEEIKTQLEEQKRKEEQEEIKGGCYIATCVYGSYDCPQVWTLRRYRDYKLLQNTFGRIFVKMYYKISPTLVDIFGKKNWFKGIFKSPLDYFVKYLQEHGLESTPYED